MLENFSCGKVEISTWSLQKNSGKKIKNERIGNDLNSDLANTRLNYRLGYAYDRFK